MDPYTTNQDSLINKPPIVARLCSIHDTRRANRGIVPILQKTRCVCAGSVHELIVYVQANPESGVIDETGYIGFAEFLTGGVLRCGDKVYRNAEYLGELAGFDETHMPNHLNILLRCTQMATGVDLNCQFADLVTFIDGKYGESL